ncbi:MAG: YjbQ family protein [Chloroflexi bacterium]|nr:YjbQ family protein [Chloroflexota bacterium]
MVVTQRIGLQTRGHGDIIDIIGPVAQEVARSGIKEGIVTIFITGSTAAVTTIEFEKGLLEDFKTAWQRLVPTDVDYQHDRAWGDGNGYSHVRAALLGASLVVPVTHGGLTLGTWQQIVVVDFDNRSRSREVVLQIMGE